MIVLDTNILSALMRRSLDDVAVPWLDHQSPESIWTTSVTVFEIRFGLEVLPLGRRRRRLEETFTTILREDLEERVLPFDQVAAESAAAISARQRRAGRPVEVRDVQIAGIVAARKASLATRNSRYFEGLGIPLINPWER